MKRLGLLIALVALGAAACAPQKKEELQSGDLIFVGIPLDYSLDSTSMSSAIAASTQGKDLNLIHVAIVDKVLDSIYVIDATVARNVSRHPLDTFLTDFTLKDGSYPTFLVKRLKTPDPEAVKRARTCVGMQYDYRFMPNNSMLYCSELVYISYLDAENKPLFHEYPMNWKDKDGNFPLYWQQLFARLDMDVPQDVPGTNPNQMSQEEILETVDVDITKYAHKKK